MKCGKEWACERRGKNECSCCLLKMYGGVTIASQRCDIHQLVEYAAL